MMSTEDFVKGMDSILLKKIRQDLQDKQDFSCRDHFPEESDPIQSAFSGKKLTINDRRPQRIHDCEQ